MPWRLSISDCRYNVSDIAAARCAARGKSGHLSSLRKDDSVMAVALESEGAPTTDRTSTRNRRIEVITGRERRRRWTAEQKREIAGESLQPGISPVMVARRYGISSGLLYTWRQQLLCGAFGAVADTKPRFVRVDVVTGLPRMEVTTPAAPELALPATPLASPTADPNGWIEIMLSGGAKVRVDAQVNEAALRRVLAALGQS
jgi:transposase